MLSARGDRKSIHSTYHLYSPPHSFSRVAPAIQYRASTRFYTVAAGYNFRLCSSSRSAFFCYTTIRIPRCPGRWKRICSPLSTATRHLYILFSKIHTRWRHLCTLWRICRKHKISFVLFIYIYVIHYTRLISTARTLFYNALSSIFGF